MSILQALTVTIKIDTPAVRRGLCAALIAGTALVTPLMARADTLSTAIANWQILRDSRQTADFLSYARFLNAHPDWPQAQGAIRINAETALLRDGADNGTLIDWFRDHPPQTDEGRVRYVQALATTGDRLAARQQAVEYWHDGFFDAARQARIAAIVGGFSNGDNAARLDTLLWRGNTTRVTQQMPYVDEASRRVAQARLALQQSASQALALVQNVPASRRDDPGLLFDRARFARRRDDDAFAAQLLQHATGKRLGDHGAAWGKERLLLARRAFEQGNPSRAFQIARVVDGLPKTERAELHWFAGWIALTRLQQPEQALALFATMHDEVATPLSIARAAYWAGAACEQAGNAAQAERWYREAARHPQVFYGLMAAYALKSPQTAMAQFARQDRGVGNGSATANSDLAQAARVFYRAGKTPERDLFLQALLNAAIKQKRAQDVIGVARETGNAKIALTAAKAAYQDGVLVLDALFPRVPFPPQDGVDPALTLAIARQESMFDPMATSSAGARGLLQLMPATAAHVANRYGVAYGGPQSLYQPRANLTLGQYYLKDMLARYDGFAPLAIAAYNAGPGNVGKFLNMNGDPRSPGRDWTDWVERIPFSETRNYVQRVWEAYVVYGYLLGPQDQR